MRYVAIIGLALLGCLELVLRMILVVVLTVSIVGLVIMIDDYDQVLKPWCFSMAERLVEGSEARAAELKRLQLRIQLLERKNDELVEAVLEREGIVS